jgi:hypothetical protein
VVVETLAGSFGVEETGLDSVEESRSCEGALQDPSHVELKRSLLKRIAAALSALEGAAADQNI